MNKHDILVIAYCYYNNKPLHISNNKRLNIEASADSFDVSKQLNESIEAFIHRIAFILGV